ncbi:nicotinate (nicotinamide) nucleotide adenylyltransferase [Bacteroides sp. 224]|uniref:nicotinate (nicotinamide) nucleotide adenylyltransferase n=1 Tax=Bacteroides sp. 224 TaxID=2302936 RepID=UPI0013D834BD|nr:nicotinate (nicotinamide) nucleotide adenylyltransferase [Bacteroides sp. 224]NDV64764.1 nicotinate-nucleotide adenylyltransferase [Bacteroides sp. 224]
MDTSQLSTLNSQLIRTGIFGGSFSPIHIGHLALANYLCEFGGLDELWFLISPQNPLKKREELWPDDFRLQLVEAAIKEYPNFKASDFEFSLPRPSYTINTLDKLKETYPNRSFELIIGSDNWANFQHWKDYQRIITENKIIIYPRPEFTVEDKDLPENASIVNAPLFDISSTFIRESLKTGKDIRYFLHPEVYKLIIKHYPKR